MVKETKNEDVQTLDAVDEDIENQNVDNVDAVESDTENTGEDTNTEIAPAGDGTVVIDGADDSGIKPLAADDYVENFVINGSTYAVRDAEAQASITELNSDLTATSVSMDNITYDSSYFSTVQLVCYKIAGLVIYSGRVVTAQTVFLDGSSVFGNLPVAMVSNNFNFPCTTSSSNLTAQCYVRTGGQTNSFYLYGNVNAGSYYAIFVIAPQG